MDVWRPAAACMFALLSMAPPGLAWAQAADPVRGQVIDAETGDPIPGAMIALAGDPTVAAIAEADGRFELAAPAGDLVLLVTATGYDTLTATIAEADRSSPLPLPLLAEAGGGEVIEITGRAPDNARTPTYDLETDELRSVPGSGNDALKSVQSLPGVARIPYGAGGLVLRGSSPRDTNVYLDGIEVPILFHFGGLASFYPSAMLASIEVAPGGFGAEYGRAQGGLVTLTSRPGRSDRWRVASEVSLIDASVRADGPGGAGGTWSLGLRRSYVDAVLALVLPEDSSAQFTLAPRYYDGQVRYDVALSKRDTLTLMLFGSDDGLGLVAESDDALDEDPDDRVDFGQGFLRLAARWERRVGTTLLSATPWVGVDKAEVRVGDDGQSRTAYPAGLRLQVTQVWNRGSLSAGLDAQGGRYDLDLRNEPPPMPGVDEMEQVVLATRDWNADVGFWVQGLYKVSGGKVDIKPGLRLERYGLSDEWVLDPRLTVSHALPAGITLKESIGLYHQPPLQSDDTWGNADLRSSYAVQGAVGIEAPLPGGIEASITGFSEQSERLPVDVVSGASPAAAGGTRNSGGTGAAIGQLLEEQFGNWAYLDDVGRGRAYGTELLVKRRGERFYGWLAYTYSRGLRRGDPARFTSYTPYVLDQPHVLTALGSVKLGADWRLGARVRYASGNPYTPAAGTYFDADDQEYVPIDGPILSERLPAFVQLDLRVDREWRRAWGTLSLFLDVQNVTNRVNPEGFDYNYDYTEIEYQRGLPIFPSIGVEYRP